jgi:hypothetical protein
MFSDPCPKISKAVERVPFSGNQFSLASFDLSERTKTIDLQLEDKLIGIERLRPA